MYKLNNAAGRIAALTMAISLLFSGLIAGLVPMITSADALNPLTQRTLLLTSSSPGWSATDGSGNSTYALPGQGANGQQTGETFSFNTSTNSTDTGAGATNTPIEAMSFQYCTTAAGLCQAPGNDASESGATPNADPPYYTDDSGHSDLNVTSGATWTEGSSITNSADFGDFLVETNNTTNNGNAADGTWSLSSGWTMSVTNKEDPASSGDLSDGDPLVPTGANNWITLENTDGIQPISNEPIKVIFFADSTHYITNPGAGAFFVKINDYSDAPTAPALPADVVDGGVTVANVMNQSIEIQTKVLETMDFSVGTVDPDTLPAADVNGHAHGQCDSILPENPTPTPDNPSPDTLLLGDPNAENSLSPLKPYGTSSMWRLSTNSANGATVYYSGNTLSDTENNHIAGMQDDNYPSQAEEAAAIGTGTAGAPQFPDMLFPGQTSATDEAALPNAGTEQFGLGLDFQLGTDLNNSNIDYTTNPASDELIPETLDGATGTSDVGATGSFAADVTSEHSSGNNYWYDPTLSPLLPEPSYGDANGTIGDPTQVDGDGNPTDPPTAKFAFNADANTTPVPIASEDTEVVDCSTGLIQYVADIAPSTPAGIYTTKINYLAAPEY